MWRFFIFFPLSLFAEISALYLSWYQDPTTTMSIQWHTPSSQYGDTIWLETPDSWVEIQGEHATIDSLLVHKVNLESLSPGTEYRFRIGETSKVYTFKTAPSTLDEPLRFVVGGDMYAKPKIFRRMCQTVLENDPHFAVLGGDLAYAISIFSSKSSALRKWLSFLKDWKDYMIHSDGKIIPFLLVPGNHDIASDDYDLFFTLFAFPKKQLYRAIDFGSYLSLFLLDTGHFQPIDGPQTVWLEKALALRQNISYRFAVYHEAAYPSFYPYQNPTSKKLRSHWIPLFEKYHLLAAFENHNHAYKRTYPLKAGQIDATGVVYLGDGGWGATARRTKDIWYLEKRQKKSSILMVEISKEGADIRAADLFNNSIDEITLKN